MTEAVESIKSSFKKLLSSTTYEKMTVSALCKNLGISRRTFYRYFDTLDDVVDALVYDDFVAPVKQVRLILPVEEIKSSGLLLIERANKTFYESRDIYKKLLNYKGHMTLVESITQQTYRLNKEIYASYDLDSDEKDFASYFVASTSAMILTWWITEREDIEPKRMSKLINTWCYSHWNEREVGEWMNKSSTSGLL